MTIAELITKRAGLQRLMAAALGVAVLLTLLGVLVQPAGVLPRNLATHAFLETVVSLIGLLACFLLLGRFWSSRALCDLLLVAGLLVLVLTNLSFGVVPALTGASSGKFSTWAHVGGRLLGVVCLAVAAFLPSRTVRYPRRAVAILLVVCPAALLGVALLVALLEPVLPVGVGRRVAPDNIASSPVLLAVQLVGTVAFALAAIGLALRALRTADELMAWISAGTVLAAFAYLNYAIVPSLYSSWVHVGDLLRVAFYLVLLFGGLREIDAYRRRARTAIQLEERQRIARELHDGLTQDLAFIAGRLRDLTLAARTREDEDLGVLEMLSEGARHALDEARAVTASFAVFPSAPLSQLLSRTAEEVASREGGRASVSVEPGLEVSDEAKEALVRLVREATTNAVRHGGDHRARRRKDDPPGERSEPVTVEVTLAERDGLELTIQDDGRGFERERPGGSGLRGMRDRATRLGGEMSIASTPGRGTLVTVHLPADVISPLAADPAVADLDTRAIRN